MTPPAPAATRRPSIEAFRAANEIPTEEVAAWCGLKKAGERGKWKPCPGCGSSRTAALHEYDDGLFCHSCRGHFTNVDLAAEMLFATAEDPPGEAVRFLMAKAGMPLNDSSLHAHVAVPRTPPKRRAKATHGAAELVPQTAAERADRKARSYVYEVFLHCLGWSARGDEFLRSRGLDPVESNAWGMRTVDGLDAWEEAVDKALDWLPDPAGLETAGLARKPLGSDPILVLPYFSVALPRRDSDPPLIDTLRFRSLTSKAYRSLTGRNLQPTVPFCAPAISRTLKPGDDVHVCEGEIDCWTLFSVHGLRAIGIPGTSIKWRPEWSEHIKHVGRLVVWLDCDKAGEKASRGLCTALQRDLDSAWVRDHARRVQLPEGEDVNSLHQRGSLVGIIRARDWR